MLVAIAVTITLGVDSATAAGARLLEDAWLHEPAWAPGGAALETGGFAWASAGTGRLFGMPELPLSALRLTAGRRGQSSAWSLAAGWQRLGREVLQVDHLAVSAGRDGRWRCRVRGVSERRTLAGSATPARRRVEAVLGCEWRAPAGFSGRGDLHLALVDGMAGDPRHVAPLMLLVLRLPPVSCALAWDRRGDGTPLLGLEVVVELSPAAAFSWRYDGGSRSLGWGLVLRRGPLLVRSSHLVHPDLGATHRWQVAAGRGRLPTAGSP
ncbi:MAG: hypothetical protein GY838_05805 [bacterium]|nr:hypothetical protein [bacterium]